MIPAADVTYRLTNGCGESSKSNVDKTAKGGILRAVASLYVMNLLCSVFEPLPTPWRIENRSDFYRLGSRRKS
jgi:hypothetical protein